MPIRVTLRDIAKATGLHFTTVGRALRETGAVGAATRRRVRDCAAKLGYVHDPMLSALSSYRATAGSRHVGTIGFITTYDFKTAMKVNVRERRMYESAREHARGLGFVLEPIRAPEKLKRLDSILIARGIQGLVLPALKPHPGPFGQLSWDKFSVVALNYSITEPNPHRVCFSQGPSMRHHLEELRALGYRRIGFALPHEINVRSGFTAAGAYLVDQQLQPAENRVQPYFPETIELDTFAHWLRQERPDCVIVQLPYLLTWIQKCGYRVPQDIGVSLFAKESPDMPFAGIDDCDDILGEAAVDLVITLLQHGERGMPKFPRNTLIEGRWISGPTVRRQAG